MPDIGLIPLTPYHIRVLIDDPNNGGCGFTLEQVQKMTLDQVFMCFADKKILNQRRKTIEPLQAVNMQKTPEGKIVGRAEDGTVILGEIKGISVARRLMEQKKNQVKEPRRKRRR